MLSFVNAKINIGLQIVDRREDGYHDLHTLFYPIGVHAGTPSNPVQFCDLLEITPIDDIEVAAAGEKKFLFESDSPYPQKQNLVYRAAELFYDRFPEAQPVRIGLSKHIPDGAGIGGGSADAAFTLRMLNELAGEAASEADLAEMALRLGADCPFFLVNRASYAAGVGERLEDITLSLNGFWLLLVRPFTRISTRDAFAAVKPRKSTFDLRGLSLFSIDTWKFIVHNDFEDSIFPRFPELGEIKKALYNSGALYASLTGSGSCLYGIYPTRMDASEAESSLRYLTTIQDIYLLQL